MKKTITMLCLSVSLLTACSSVKMAQQAYPERLQYVFADESLDTTNTYLCKSIDGAAKTKIRAKKAHQFVSKRIKEVTSEAMAKMFEGEEFSFMAALGSSMDLSKGAEKVAKEVEAKYQCLLVDASD